MSSSLNVRIVTYPAAADLSLKQYYFAKLTSTGADLNDVAGGPVLGSIQECASATAAGRAVGIAVGDKIQAIAAGVIAPGGAVASDGDGKAVAATLGATSSSNIVGYYEGTANSAAGDIITIVKSQSIGAAPTTPT